MRIVIALGGNALLRRGEPLTADNQRKNARIAAEALAPIAREHDLVITHGNGPQVGLLALQGAAAFKSNQIFPLDILDAETEGMIGYMIEQELANLLPGDQRCATLLTQVEVEAGDPAFSNPTKPIGPVYTQQEALRLARQRGWSIAPEGDYFRRVVPSPRPKRILELGVIELLIDQGINVICVGGGGIPVVRRGDGSLTGVEAVIDKDRASSLLACALKAEALLMLTDVDGVYRRWGEPEAQRLYHLSPDMMDEYEFAAGSMAPKVEAGFDYVEQTGGMAAIGALKDARLILRGAAGTRIAKEGGRG